MLNDESIKASVVDYLTNSVVRCVDNDVYAWDLKISRAASNAELKDNEL